MLTVVGFCGGALFGFFCMQTQQQILKYENFCNNTQRDRNATSIETTSTSSKPTGPNHAVLPSSSFASIAVHSPVSPFAIGILTSGVLYAGLLPLAVTGAILLFSAQRLSKPYLNEGITCVTIFRLKSPSAHSGMVSDIKSIFHNPEPTSEFIDGQSDTSSASENATEILSEDSDNSDILSKSNLEMSTRKEMFQVAWPRLIAPDHAQSSGRFEKFYPIDFEFTRSLVERHAQLKLELRSQQEQLSETEKHVQDVEKARDILRQEMRLSERLCKYYRMSRLSIQTECQSHVEAVSTVVSERVKATLQYKQCADELATAQADRKDLQERLNDSLTVVQSYIDLLNETKTRLEHTQAELDIVREACDRMNSPKQQADDAERKQELDDAHAELGMCKQNTESATQTIQTASTIIKLLRDKISEQGQEITSLKTKIHAASEEQTQCENSAKEQHDRLQQVYDKLAVDHKQTKKDLGHASNVVGQLKKEKTSLEGRCNSLEEKMHKAEQNHQLVTKQQAGLYLALEQQKILSVKHQSRGDNLQKQVMELEKQIQARHKQEEKVKAQDEQIAQLKEHHSSALKQQKNLTAKHQNRGDNLQKQLEEFEKKVQVMLGEHEKAFALLNMHNESVLEQQKTITAEQEARGDSLQKQLEKLCVDPPVQHDQQQRVKAQEHEITQLRTENAQLIEYIQAQTAEVQNQSVIHTESPLQGVSQDKPDKPAIQFRPTDMTRNSLTQKSSSPKTSESNQQTTLLNFQGEESKADRKSSGGDNHFAQTRVAFEMHKEDKTPEVQTPTSGSKLGHVLQLPGNVPLEEVPREVLSVSVSPPTTASSSPTNTSERSGAIELIKRRTSIRQERIVNCRPRSKSASECEDIDRQTKKRNRAELKAFDDRCSELEWKISRSERRGHEILEILHRAEAPGHTHEEGMRAKALWESCRY